MKGCRIGVDVGGTFTDFVLSDHGSGALTYYKEPSVPEDPAVAVANGVAAILERAGLATDSIELINHGTTLALNAILQSKGADVALVISRGFRDTITLGRGGLPNPYDYKHPKQTPLIAPSMVFDVDARVRPDGSVIAEPDAAALDALAADIGATDAKAAAVVVLNSYQHPEVERRVVQGLAERLPGVLVTGSAELWPVIREFERSLVTTLNAYVHPLMNDYYGHLESLLRDKGVSAPIYISTSNGGSMSVGSARQRPVDTLLSGPASGVVAAAEFAKLSGQEKLITLDMGGTSSDIAITQDGEPEFTTETRLGDLPLVLPVVNVWAIGAGGGSIVWVDPQGVLKVGPESAGANPGPVCYGRGGTQPTVTDCYVVAGYLDPADFLGGRMSLDRAAAEAALAKIGETIGLEGEDVAVRAADAALRVATAKMATEVSKGMAQRGLDPAEFALMPYGGAGPTHGNLLANEVGLSTMVVPPSPGTFCALGAIMSDIKRDFARSRRLSLGLDPAAAESLRGTIEELEAEAMAWLGEQGDVVSAPSVEVTCDMQYPRTAFELNTAVPEAAWRSGSAERLAELFHLEHERLYGFRDADSPVDITTVRLRVHGKVPAVRLPEASGEGAAVPAEERDYFDGQTWRKAQVYRRDALPAGSVLQGPAVVEQEDSTVWVLAGWRATTDKHGVLRLTRDDAS